MKIIEENHSERKIGFKVICTGEGYLSKEDLSCGSILLLQTKDVMKYNYQNLDGSKSHDYYFICPVCNRRTRIDESKIFNQSPIVIKYKEKRRN